MNEQCYLWQLFLQTLPNFFADVGFGILVYLLSDFIFKYPDINGKWKFELEIQHTAYEPYLHMTMTYIAFLQQSGNRIFGSGEKIQDKVKTGLPRDYFGENRTRIRIDGTIQKHLWKRDTVLIHYTEENEVRESTTIHMLRIQRGKIKMVGNFYSSISDQSGVVDWTKE